LVQKISKKNKIFIAPQFRLSANSEALNESVGGFVDYSIENNGNIICITESKQHDIPAGVAQNFVQLDSALQVRVFIFCSYLPRKILLINQLYFF